MTDAISASGLVKIFGRTRADRLRHFAPGLWLPQTTGGGAGVAGGGGVSPAANGLPDPDRARGVQPERGSYREEVIEDCGHSPHIEKPEEFRQTLFGFLRGH